MLADTKCRQRLAWGNGEIGKDHRRRGRQGSPICVRVRQDPENRIKVAITQLELDPPKLRLSIDEASVRVEGKLTLGARQPCDERVPCSLVAKDG